MTMVRASIVSARSPCCSSASATSSLDSLSPTAAIASRVRGVSSARA
jgi:hypothetical protein